MGVQERKKREKELRHEAIIDAAEKIFFSNGYENTSMDEVSREAELGKGTIYLYFKNKHELFHAVVARGLEILLDSFVKAVSVPKTGMEKIMAIGRAYYDFFLNQRDYFDALSHAEAEEVECRNAEDCPNTVRCGELGDRIFGLTMKTLEEGIRDGTLRPGIDPLKLSLSLWGQATGIFTLVARKGVFLKEIWGIGGEEIVAYHFDLIRSSIENKPKSFPRRRR